MCKFTWYYTIMVLLIFLQHQIVSSSAAAMHLSPTMQKNALFQFKLSLAISTLKNCYYDSYTDRYIIPSHPKTMNWSMSSNHCTWEGVSCEHKTGNVIGLDLSCSQLEGAILANSTLFQLSHLQFLNLSNNYFSLSNQFPREFGFFAKGLTHLNLSHTHFSGRVPSGISHLYKLVSLDLSSYIWDNAQLEEEVFKSVMQNMSQLRVLNLEYVRISSVIPMNLSTSLRVLNLYHNHLHGELPQEVFHLPNLQVLDLFWNENLTGMLPTNLSTSLRVLDLEGIGLHGVIPQEVFHLPNLEVLRVFSYNQLRLPKVKWGSTATLRVLDLVGIDMDGGIPDSISFLRSLSILKLVACNLSGPIPTTIGNLGQLTSLNLGSNNFNGPIPTDLVNLTKLTDLRLSGNNFSGPLPFWVSPFKELTLLDLSDLSLTGPLPPWLFDHPSLRYLYLSSNRFTGQLHEFNSSKSQLHIFDCSNNLLHGPIPQSFFYLANITSMDFSSNNFSGVLNIEILPRNIETIDSLDLSNNQIAGEIPHWISLMGSRSLPSSYLNLSYNRLTGGLEQLPWNSIAVLDLQFNMLNGSLPALFCNSTSLEILNLSHNKLSGVLPSFPTNLMASLLVVDLQMNNIEGSLPSTLSNCRNLQSINLHGNKLQGRIPSSFAQFDQLETLDLGSNQINDTFPHCLEALPNLQVLVLKSNNFHGLINKSSTVEHPFPSLRIIDLSYNEFSGLLPATYFRNFKAMMNHQVNQGELSYMDQGRYYTDSTTLVIKGVEIVLKRILTILTTIDISSNNFEGEIADYFGNLVSLRLLNLSHNHLTGHIPPSIGNLTLLESLDLSANRLEGEIPQQLTSIYSLELLNLSYNQLRGHIPQGFQFDTFENNSYVGNFGLCGKPLSKECEHDIVMQQEGEDKDEYFFSGFTWEAVVIGYGCGVIPAFIIGYLMLMAGKPKWYAGIIARELGLKIRRMEIKLL